MNASALAARLNLKPGMKLRVVGKPADVDSRAGPAVDPAREDRIAWLAKGIQGVRQIALDEVWSAMRFRPKK